MENERNKTESTPDFYVAPLPDKRVYEAYDPLNGLDPASFCAAITADDEDEDDAPRPPRSRWAPAFFAVLLLTALAALAIRGLRVLPAVPAAAVPTAAPTPAPTPAPTATPTPVAALPALASAAEPAPEAAYVPTTVLVNGKARGTLISREAAEALLFDIKAYFADEVRQNNEVAGTLEVTLTDEVTFEDATDAETTTADELFALLTAGRYRLRANCTETVTAVETVPYDAKTEKDKYLLAGTQVIVAPGAEGRKETVTIVTYADGKKKSAHTGEETVVREKEDRLVRVGTEKLTTNDAPGKREGAKGPDTALVFAAPVAQGKIVSNFGQRSGVLHLGLDYTAEENAPVLAACAGTVVCVLERGGYGLMAEIDHGEGFVTRYAHLASSAVQPGETVTAGQTIGVLGQSGNADAPHLHFELRVDGEPYNPRYYLP